MGTPRLPKGHFRREGRGSAQSALLQPRALRGHRPLTATAAKAPRRARVGWLLPLHPRNFPTSCSCKAPAEPPRCPAREGQSEGTVRRRTPKSRPLASRVGPGRAGPHPEPTTLSNSHSRAGTRPAGCSRPRAPPTGGRDQGQRWGCAAGLLPRAPRSLLSWVRSVLPAASSPQGSARHVGERGAAAWPPGVGELGSRRALTTLPPRPGLRPVSCSPVK